MNLSQKAFIFDLNGTIIDDMGYHLNVWFDILTSDLGAAMTIQEAKSHMYGKNSELLERIFGKGHFTEEEMNYWSLEKEKRYQKIYLPHMKLIDGLDKFFEKAFTSKVPMAIGSAAIPFNIDYVLDNLNIRKYFSAIVSADDVTESKPHPETFLKAARLLNKKPDECIVFEDAPKGVEAAQNAGMKTIVLLTAHKKEEFKKYDNMIAAVKDYTEILDSDFRF